MDRAGFDDDRIEPNGRSSTRRLSLSPSTANLAEWYQPSSGS
jgi:hypothetical protein